ATSPDDFHAGDIIKVTSSVGSNSLILYGGAGVGEYDLSAASISGISSLSLASGAQLNMGTSFAPFTSIGGDSASSLVFAAAAVDLSGKTVSVRVTSTNAAGTTFTVADATTALAVFGGPGQDT